MYVLWALSSVFPVSIQVVNKAGSNLGVQEDKIILLQNLVERIDYQKFCYQRFVIFCVEIANDCVYNKIKDQY